MRGTGRLVQDQPPRWRVIAAFLVAPLVSAFALAVYEPLYEGLPDMTTRVRQSWFDYAVFGGYPTALLFGVPAYLLLRRRVKPTWFACALAGGAVAAAPWLIFMILPTFTYEKIGSHVTVQNGVRTVWGWVEGLSFAGKIGAFGLIGGLAFWAVAIAGWRPRAAA